MLIKRTINIMIEFALSDMHKRKTFLILNFATKDMFHSIRMTECMRILAMYKMILVGAESDLVNRIKFKVSHSLNMLSYHSGCTYVNREMLSIRVYELGISLSRPLDFTRRGCSIGGFVCLTISCTYW